LIAEKKKPKADIFWNGELIQMIRLASSGVLNSYLSREKPINNWNDPDNYWSAFGGRIRVLIVNNAKKNSCRIPKKLTNLINSDCPADKTALALPLFGTSATHAAMIWITMGDEKASVFFKKLKDTGVSFLNGNSLVRDKVVSGDKWLGITDSDDACTAVLRGAPISIYFLNQSPDDIGTLVIPNTVALVSGAPNQENGKKLIDFLLSYNSRVRLAELGWFHIIDNHLYEKGTNCPLPKNIHIQNINLESIINGFEKSQNYLRGLFFK